MPTPLSRRKFLAAGAVSLAAAPLASLWAQSTTKAPAKAPVVDAHLHCFAGADARFPYHQRAPYRPAEAATPERLLERMDQAGVDFAIVVHPEPYQDDHRYLEHCLQVGGKRLKGTCLVFADDPQSLAQLPALAKKLPLVAARVHAYAPDRLPPFGKPELRALWKQAGELGLAVQLHFEPRYASGFEPLIREFTDTRVIIDHLGRPLQGTPEEYATVLAWAKHKHTVMKISSLTETKSYPHRDLAPIIGQLAEAYGPDRLIYGGGFDASATGDSYRAYRDKVRGYLPKLSAEELARVLGGNAARMFGFA